MKEISYTIQDEAGIHMRPAGKLVECAKGFSSELSLCCGQRQCDLKRLFALMGLTIKQGETVTITAKGEDEAEAISAVQAYLEHHL